MQSVDLIDLQLRMEKERNNSKEINFGRNFARMVQTLVVFLLIGVFLNHYVRIIGIKATFKITWVLLCFGIIHYFYSRTLAHLYNLKFSKSPPWFDCFRQKLSPSFLKRLGFVVLLITSVLLIDIFLIVLKMGL